MIKKLLSKFRSKSKDNRVPDIQKAIEEYIYKQDKYRDKTYVLVEFIKKDDSIQYMVKEIDGHSVEVGEDNIKYYAEKDFFKTLEYTKDDEKYRIPKIILFEGVTSAYNARKIMKYLRQPGFSEKFQKAMYIDIKSGIMEEQKQRKIDLRKWIAGGLFGVAALFIVYKMFVG